MELHEWASLIDRATQSPHPWPDGGRRSGGRATAAAFATALHARCQDAVLRQDTGRLPASEYEDPASTPCSVASVLLQPVRHDLLVTRSSPENEGGAVTWPESALPEYAMPSWY